MLKMILLNFFLIIFYQSITLANCSEKLRSSLSEQIIVGRPFSDDSELEQNNRIITIDDQGTFRVTNSKFNSSSSTLKSSLLIAVGNLPDSNSNDSATVLTGSSEDDDDDGDEDAILNDKAQEPKRLIARPKKSKATGPGASAKHISRTSSTAIGDHSLAEFLARQTSTSTQRPRQRQIDAEPKLTTASRRIEETDEHEPQSADVARWHDKSALEQDQEPDDLRRGDKGPASAGAESLAEPMIEGE